MEFDKYKNIIGDISDSAFDCFLSQCGLIAVHILDRLYQFNGFKRDPYSKPYWETSSIDIMRHMIRPIVDLNKKLLHRIHANGEMDYIDIVNTMKVFHPKLLPDFRFNSKERDVNGRLFLKGMTGITALKFTGTWKSHWAVVWNGSVLPLVNDQRETFTDIKEMKSKIKNFDGFGHTIIFWTKEGVEFLEQYKECRKEHCALCSREKWCVESTQEA